MSTFLLRLNRHLKILTHQLAVSDRDGTVGYDGSQCDGQGEKCGNVPPNDDLLLLMMMMMMMMMMKMMNIMNMMMMMMRQSCYPCIIVQYKTIFVQSQTILL